MKAKIWMGLVALLVVIAVVAVFGERIDAQVTFPNLPIITIADGLALTTANKQAAVGMGYNGSTADMMRVVTAADSAALTYSLKTHSLQMVHNGTTLTMARSPSTFKTYAGTPDPYSTYTTVWTPASGRKIRLLGFTVYSAATDTITLYNPAETALFKIKITAVNQAFDLGSIGIVLTADQTLSASTDATSALTGTFWGTEE